MVTAEMSVLSKILYFVAVAPNSRLSLVMFLIECSLYESNTTCTSSYRLYSHSIRILQEQVGRPQCLYFVAVAPSSRFSLS